MTEVDLEIVLSAGQARLSLLEKQRNVRKSGIPLAASRLLNLDLSRYWRAQLGKSFALTSLPDEGRIRIPLEAFERWLSNRVPSKARPIGDLIASAQNDPAEARS